jgi:hypothetical protein
MTPSRPQRSGFTLVETALALLAISLGLLGIFGLARHGLKDSGDAEQEVRCAVLADTFFATLHAKNDEMTAKKATLYEWWMYWFRFASGTSEVVLFLPYMPDISPNDDAVRIALGTHELDDYLTPPTGLTKIRWNPTYTLMLDLNGVNPSDPGSIAEVYERGEIDVTLTIHPGALLSGAEARTYWTTLAFTGGLP